MKIKKNLPILASFMMLFFMFSCQKDFDNYKKNPFDTNNSRISLLNKKIPINPDIKLKYSAVENIEIGYEFVLIAEVESPSVNNKLLQATHVEIVGDLAFVSYNMKGVETLGAIDIINISSPSNPFLVNSITFDDKDINTVGWYNDNYIIAGQDYNGAFYGQDDEFYNLPSYSVVTMVVDNGVVYIVTGDSGGLVIIDNDDIDFIPITDARSVAIGNDIYVLSSSGIHVIDGQLISIDNNYLQNESKADIDISDEYLFVALNRGGVYIYDITDLSVIQTLDRPITPNGLESEDFVTNSVSFNPIQSLLFVADGGAGIKVCGKTDHFKSDELFLEYGYFDFGGQLSSNFVMSEDEFIFVASGLGGLKILTIVQIEDNPEPENPCEYWENETAYVGSDLGGGSAWWYYFDNISNNTHPIYAGQNLIEDASATYFNSVLTIDLGDKMSLRNVSESVKIQGYYELPLQRPSAGQFTTYKGTDLVIELPYFPYYVIHLDVKVCKDNDKHLLY